MYCEMVCVNYNFRDRTGERYGKLTVLERAEDAVFDSGKLVQWKCRCDCGNIKVVIGCNLQRTRSCGCDMYGHNLEDLTGKRFGILTALERVENKTLPCGQRQTMWRCRCDCGSYVTVRAATLKNGDTKSCGCIKSHRERLIAERLAGLGVSFEREYEFEDCVNHNGNAVKFDFALFDTQKNLICLIEHQGQQHYFDESNPNTFGKMQREETDRLKKEYCKTHNISLYEIKYNDDINAKLDDILHDNTVLLNKTVV